MPAPHRSATVRLSGVPGHPGAAAAAGGSTSRWLEALDVVVSPGVERLRIDDRDSAVDGDVGAVVAAARDAGVAHVTLATDGARFDGAVGAALAATVDAVVLDIHSDNPRVHDAVVRRRGAHGALVNALNVLAPTRSRVRLRLTLWSRAAQDVRALVNLVSDALRRPFEVDVRLPEQLPAGPNGARLAPPDIEGIRARIGHLAAALDACDGRLVVSYRSGIPACAVPRAQRESLLASEGGAQGMFPPLPCGACAARASCPGLHGWYVREHGSRGLEALPAPLKTTGNRGSAPVGGIDWRRYEDALESARDAFRAGDNESARAAAWSAFGFESLPPAVPAGEIRQADPEDDLSLQLERAVEALGVKRSEEVAYLAGVKPVLYLTVPFDELPEVLERYKGHAIGLTDPSAGDPLAPGVSRAHAHLFVGRTPEGPDFCTEVYRHGDPTRQAAEVGAWMGYPRCCAEAFAASADNSNDSVNVYAAARRTAGPGHALLNLGAGYLIPFYPCSFDCEHAAEFAERVLDTLYPGDAGAEARDDVRRRMARPTLYFDKQFSVFLEGNRDGTGVDYRGAEYACHSRDLSLDSRIMTLTLGGIVDGSSQVDVRDDTWTFDGPLGRIELARRNDAPGILLPFTPRSESR